MYANEQIEQIPCHATMFLTRLCKVPTEESSFLKREMPSEKVIVSTWNEWKNFLKWWKCSTICSTFCFLFTSNEMFYFLLALFNNTYVSFLWYLYLYVLLFYLLYSVICVFLVVYLHTYCYTFELFTKKMFESIFLISLFEKNWKK